MTKFEVDTVLRAVSGLKEDICDVKNSVKEFGNDLKENTKTTTQLEVKIEGLVTESTLLKEIQKHVETKHKSITPPNAVKTRKYFEYGSWGAGGSGIMYIIYQLLTAKFGG